MTAKLQLAVYYIGNTTTSPSRRLTVHVQNGSIRNHTRETHDAPLTREMLEPNTEIIDNVSDAKRLKYLEAILYINIHKPPLNVQGINAIILPSDRERRRNTAH